MRRIALAAAIMCLGPLAGMAQDTREWTTREEEYPTPERHFATGNLSQFAREAMAFLREHPASEHAPRVALDLFVASMVSRDAEAEAVARATLLLQYPHSLGASYVLTTYTQPGEYASFLSDRFAEYVDGPQPGFPREFIGAAHTGLGRFGNALLQDRGLALECALIALETGERQLAGAAMESLRTFAGGSDARREIEEVCLDPQVEPAEKVVLLHALPPWPQLPVVTGREVDQALIMEMYMGVLKLAGEARGQ